jgi:hypothetical protein
MEQRASRSIGWEGLCVAVKGNSFDAVYMLNRQTIEGLALLPSHLPIPGAQLKRAVGFCVRQIRQSLWRCFFLFFSRITDSTSSREE